MCQTLKPVLGFTLVLVFGLPAGAVEHTPDSPAKIRKAVTGGTAVLVDVREADEWQEGHLKEAVLLPLSVLKAGITPEQLTERKIPKGKVLYLHCGSGRRSLKAAEILLKLGYPAQPLKPGYQDLLNNGFPAAK